MNMKRAAALAVSAVLLGTAAYADGFAVYEVSARGVGMAGAMMFSDEASLVYYNPAGLWRLRDNGKGQLSGAITYIAPRGQADFIDNTGSTFLTQHNKNDPAYIPTFFYGKRINDRLAWGLGLFARYGLRASYDHEWYGRYSNRSANFTSYSFSPALSWKITPELAIGVSAEVMYARLQMDKSFAWPGNYAIDLDGDDWGFGWGIGLDWQPKNSKLSAAFFYRSEVKQTIEGDINISNTPYGTIPTSGVGTIHLPDSYTFGLGWKFDDKNRVEANAIKTMWDNYNELPINISVPTAFQRVLSMSSYPYSEAKNWRNGWRYQFGYEHRINEKWAVRCGFVYDTASADNPDYSDYIVPTGTRRTYTIGASYRNKNVEYSFAYGYMKVSDKRINKAGDGSYAGHGYREDSYTRGCDAHIISLGAAIEL